MKCVAWQIACFKKLQHLPDAVTSIPKERWRRNRISGSVQRSNKKFVWSMPTRVVFYHHNTGEFKCQRMNTWMENWNTCFDTKRVKFWEEISCATFTSKIRQCIYPGRNDKKEAWKKSLVFETSLKSSNLKTAIKIPLTGVTWCGDRFISTPVHLPCSSEVFTWPLSRVFQSRDKTERKII